MIHNMLVVLKKNANKVLFVSLLSSISVWMVVFFTPVFVFIEDNVYVYLLVLACCTLFNILYLHREYKTSKKGMCLSGVTILLCILYIVYACIVFKGKYSPAIS